MMRSFKALAAMALAGAILSPVAGEAQAVHRHHARQPAAAEGRDITVYGSESYLTAGTGATVGEFNNYALDTFSSSPTTFVPNVDHTTVGVRGLARIPNNFTVPDCCFP